MQKVQQLRQNHLCVRNHLIGIATFAAQAVCFDCGRLDSVFCQPCAFGQHGTQFIAVQAAPREVLDADAAGLVIAHQPGSRSQLALRIKSGLMQPVEEVFFLCGGFCVQRRPCFIFVGIADEAAQIERLRRIRRDGQDGVRAFCLCDRFGQVALRQKFFRFFVAPVVQSVLRIL